MLGVITGTGRCLPGKKRSNHDIAQLVETSDAWIRERTGVRNRHVVETETTSSMAVAAAKEAVSDASLEAIDIDMIIVATISSDVIMPSTACMVQSEIGASNAVAFDLNAACSGFIFAYHTAQVYISMGLVTNVLIIGAESLSHIVNWEDRGTCILFGDGAGAVVLSAKKGKPHPCVMHSNGGKGSVLTCDTMSPQAQMTDKFDIQMQRSDNHDIQVQRLDNHYIQMNGQEVFKFAVRKVPEVVEELLRSIGVSSEDIDYYILHQANKRIVESVAKRLALPLERFPMNLEEYGNTSSASIPILLDELHKAGRLKGGMKLIMAGFGAGLTWGAAYLEWQE